MKWHKRTAVVMLSLVVCIAFTGCDKKDSSTQEPDESSSAVVSDSSSTPSPVPIKEYSFPEFMKSIEDPDLLSRLIYQSFDKSKAETAVTEQPFKDKVCVNRICDNFYTFSTGTKMGLLNKEGVEVIAANKYTKITPVTKNVIMCSYMNGKKEENDKFTLFENGGISKHKFYGFDPMMIVAMEYNNVDPATGESKKSFVIQNLDSEVEYPKGNTLWDTAEKCDPKKLSTGKTYRAYYKATRGGASYYICFDDNYNYDIYEASYAKIRVKVGNVSGECYVQSFEDYTELQRMVKSFGKAKASKTPDENETLDYIQITFGLNTTDQYVMTMSSDGWCLTDNLTHNTLPDNKYFACYDKDSFVSLVQWVDQVMSKEYNVQSKK
ncbi:MAG: hypothetical protein IKH90_07445 [Ruminococcus sp.]|nr:hypothetical protein [Ruminococcus sp.]